MERREIILYLSLVLFLFLACSLSFPSPLHVLCPAESFKPLSLIMSCPASPEITRLLASAHRQEERESGMPSASLILHGTLLGLNIYLDSLLRLISSGPRSFQVLKRQSCPPLWPRRASIRFINPHVKLPFSPHFLGIFSDTASRSLWNSFPTPHGALSF